MIPGSYSVCHMTFATDDSDAPTYRTLRWGYDTAKQAYANLPDIARDSGVEAPDCVVIRHIDACEADAFSS